jgi:cell shape-determining protein MreC
MHSEDWDIVVPLFKKLQEDWKKIGHVPRSQTNKVWDDFREACNTFFNNFRAKNNAQTDDWKENYKQKRALLDELKEIGSEEGSVEKIEQIKTSWNNIGKVPRDKMAINSEFNKTLKDKLRLNRINEFDLKEEGLSESQITDKARKVKNQIADLEAEIVKLENNLSFFGKVSRDNPLLKDTFDKIDEKKSQLESLKNTLHHIISGE